MNYFINRLVGITGVCLRFWRKQFVGRRFEESQTRLGFLLTSYYERTYGSPPDNAVIENTQPNGWVFSMVGITGVEPVTLRM